jgi:hypothetical protein
MPKLPHSGYWGLKEMNSMLIDFLSSLLASVDAFWGILIVGLLLICYFAYADSQMRYRRIFTPPPSPPPKKWGEDEVWDETEFSEKPKHKNDQPVRLGDDGELIFADEVVAKSATIDK